MQGSRLPFDDDAAESRLPVSTLRSTASPYKRAQFTASTNQYTALWTQMGQNGPKPNLTLGRSNIHSVLTTPLSVGNEHSDVARDESAIRHVIIHPSSPQRDSVSETSEIDAFDASSNAPSSPLAVPGSPSSSVAADISGAFDTTQDVEDDLTESDHSPFERGPKVYSPFSSPLSSIADTLAERGATPCPPSTVPNPPDESLASSQSEAGPSTSRRKRPRTPSPPRKAPASRAKGRKSKSEMPVKTSKEKEGSGRKPSRRPLEELSPRSLKAATDLVGPLVQILALSGRSSMPTSTIINELFMTTPSLKSERTSKEWTALVILIMSSHSIFGQAERAGLKNANDEAVEDEWFYRPENDDDHERRETLGAFQRGGGKRRATVEKKQYFWKPVR
ncbi:SubName: Full=Uncharacterized protein {ECO:0000313/EMBL:CCA70324.1} [Serendipita indica DSM 11827]|uniref:Uncharacterized protein n=1 Tax=Serendipita indica (strain DSM 11827) TaxID=1109443 RepID=G4TGA0_SERID|nr:SubName: Full=Uncharacterized protein {ECO:0000313/EMBL:CCA70324.1} [Serendipita indica DSM 11827]CCA70324.1 hypothetical protein PIIN_04263 [Serendipita indica DSM 11827]